MPLSGGTISMEHLGNGGRKPEALASVCVVCRSDVDVHVTHGIVDGPGGSQASIAYADTDIVVWECPACGTANADTADH